MKLKFWIGLLLLVVASFDLYAQSAAIKPVVTKEKSPSKQAVTSVRIENSKVYVNDQPVATKDLPPSLQKIDPAIYYEAAVSGIVDLVFNLNGQAYVLREGKLVETESDAFEDDSYTNEATEAYFSQLRREAPSLFYGLSSEGVLLEQIRSLMWDYANAKAKEKAQIREDIRVVLSQLFELNERNKELEIKELEEMIEAAKQEVQYRKSHKTEIIGKTLDNLLR